MDNTKINIFYKIISMKSISTVFQPIVSLKDGSIFAYEALSRISIPQCDINIEELFHISEQQNKLWELEKLCRTKALKNAICKPKDAKLFINVDPNIIHDADTFSGFTHQKLLQYGFNAHDIVFEITERSAINDLNTFTSAISHYQTQDFQIAIDDFGSGYSGINPVCCFSPNFLKIDMELVRDINSNTKKYSLVSAIVKFCKESNIKVIAEGIETEAELKSLIQLGINYGQGYYLAKPSSNFVSIPDKLQQYIHTQNMLDAPDGLLGKIQTITKQGLCLHESDTIYPLYEAMINDLEINEACILNKQGHVLGLLTRTSILERFSGQFGFNLSKWCIAKNFIDKDFIAVDLNTPIEKVASLAMERESKKVYDAIIVTKEDVYYGTVSIKDLLKSTISLQVTRAQNSSPLTGLPGNTEIQKHLSTKINCADPFSIIYIDIDDFKPYNDAYGFTMGDQMIKRLSTIIKKFITPDDFIGHIGGDDFVIITNYHDSNSLCQKIIDTFKTDIHSLYTPEDLEQGYIVSKNRNGFLTTFPLATISIAIVTNQNKIYTSSDELSKTIAYAKKTAKMKKGNSIAIV